jgi:hypothetical protein
MGERVRAGVTHMVVPSMFFGCISMSIHEEDSHAHVAMLDGGHNIRHNMAVAAGPVEEFLSHANDIPC